MTRMLRLTRDQLGALNAKSSPNKFGARKKMVDGIIFDSTHEAEVYMGLKLRAKAGEIWDLECHVPMRIEVNGVHVFNYEADFRYKAWRPSDSAKLCTVYSDAKGYKKGAAYQLFRLKAKIIHAALGIEIEEV